MDVNKLCPGCFEEVENNQVGVCPHCGYSFERSVQQGYQLKPFSILQGRYLLGKVCKEEELEIVYLGFDLVLEHKVTVKEFYPKGYVTRNTLSSRVEAIDVSYEQYLQEKKENFIKEAKILVQYANRPGIQGVREFFQENDTAYMILDYMEEKEVPKKPAPVIQSTEGTSQLHTDDTSMVEKKNASVYLIIGGLIGIIVLLIVQLLSFNGNRQESTGAGGAVASTDQGQMANTEQDAEQDIEKDMEKLPKQEEEAASLEKKEEAAQAQAEVKQQLESFGKQLTLMKQDFCLAYYGENGQLPSTKYGEEKGTVSCFGYEILESSQGERLYLYGQNNMGDKYGYFVDEYVYENGQVKKSDSVTLDMDTSGVDEFTMKFYRYQGEYLCIDYVGNRIRGGEHSESGIYMIHSGKDGIEVRVSERYSQNDKGAGLIGKNYGDTLNKLQTEGLERTCKYIRAQNILCYYENMKDFVQVYEYRAINKFRDWLYYAGAYPVGSADAVYTKGSSNPSDFGMETDYENSLDITNYSQYQDSTYPDFDICYPNQLYHDAVIDSNPFTTVFGKNRVTVSLYGKDTKSDKLYYRDGYGSEAIYGEYTRDTTRSRQQNYEMILNYFNVTLDTATVLLERKAEPGCLPEDDFDKFIITGYRDSSKTQMIYLVVKVLDDRVLTMWVESPITSGDRTSMDYKEKCYVMETLERYCSYTRGKRAPRTFDMYLSGVNYED